MFKMYSLYDKIGKRHLSITLSINDSDFVRSNLFAILMDYPITDVEAYCVGDFYEDNGIVVPCSPRLVDWNCYKFPKNADSFEENYLTIEDLREAALKKKQEFDSKRLDRIEDFKEQIKAIDKELTRTDLSENQRENLLAYKQDVLNTIKSMEVA